MRPAFHSMGVHLLLGSLFVVVIALLARAVVAWGKPDTHSRFAEYCDRTAYAAGGIGLVLSIASFVSGFLIWELEAALRSPLIRNKIHTSGLLVVVWTVFMLVRWRYGPALWRSGVLGALYTGLALVGFFFGMLSGSIGGDVAGNASGFETLVRLFGVETRFTFYLPTWVNIVILLGGLGALALSFGLRREPATADVEQRSG